MAYLREELHPSVSSRAIGLYIAGNAIGGLTGRLLGGFLTDLAGWRLALGGVAVLGVACAVAVRALLPRARPVRAGATAPGRCCARWAARSPTRRCSCSTRVAAFLMAAFVAVYNAGTFRLESAPYCLTPALASLVFLAYLLGSASSPTAAWLADRSSRRLVVPVSVLVMGAGLGADPARPAVVLRAGAVRADRRASSPRTRWPAAGWRPAPRSAADRSGWRPRCTRSGTTSGPRSAAPWPAGLAGGRVDRRGACSAGGSTLATLLLTVALGRTRSLDPTAR